jgi:hypothetical protein
MHRCIDAYMHACMHAYMCERFVCNCRIHTYIHAHIPCIHTCIHILPICSTYKQRYVPFSYTHICMHTCMHTYVLICSIREGRHFTSNQHISKATMQHSDTHTLIYYILLKHSYLHEYTSLKFIPTWTHVHIHTCIHARIHIYTYSAYISVYDSQLSTPLAHIHTTRMQTYIHTYIHSVDGQLEPYTGGKALNLGMNGCGPVRLKENTLYWLEVEAGSAYYSWRGWFQSLGPSMMQISLALYPKIPKCNSMGVTLQVPLYLCVCIMFLWATHTHMHARRHTCMYRKVPRCNSMDVTLQVWGGVYTQHCLHTYTNTHIRTHTPHTHTQWCEGDPKDLDIFMFLPAVEGGTYSTLPENTVYWGISPGVTPASRYQGNGADRGGATFTLENDDTGGEFTDPRTFGPESIFIQGKPMPGK